MQNLKRCCCLLHGNFLLDHQPLRARSLLSVLTSHLSGRDASFFVGTCCTSMLHADSISVPMGEFLLRISENMQMWSHASLSICMSSHEEHSRQFCESYSDIQSC